MIPIDNFLTLILFVVDQVIYENENVKCCIRNPKSFENMILGKKKGISGTKARCLQYLCITVFYEIVALSFVRHYSALLEKSDSMAKSYLSETAKKLPFRNAVPYMRKIVFLDYFSRKRSRDLLSSPESRELFQEKFGYPIYVKYIVPIVVSKKADGKSSATAKQTNQAKGKKKSATSPKAAALGTQDLIGQSSTLPGNAPVSRKRKTSAEETVGRMQVSFQESIFSLINDLTEKVSHLPRVKVIY